MLCSPLLSTYLRKHALSVFCLPPPQVVLVTDMKQHFNTVKTFTDKVVPLAAGVAASALAAVQRGKGKVSAKSALLPTLVSHRSLDSTSSRPSPGGSRPSPGGPPTSLAHGALTPWQARPLGSPVAAAI